MLKILVVSVFMFIPSLSFGGTLTSATEGRFQILQGTINPKFEVVIRIDTKTGEAWLLNIDGGISWIKVDEPSGVNAPDVADPKNKES